MDREAELEIVRSAYAKRVMFVAGVHDRRVEAAFASVPRERFLGRGPWPILRWDRGYVPTPSRNAVYIYDDVLIGLAGLPVWLWLGHHPAARAALAGINATVVGVLGAALYNPIWLSAVGNGRDVAIALVGFLLLERWRVPPLAIVVFCVGAALVSAAANSAS